MIFVINIAFVIIGILYSFFLRFLKGEIAFVVLFLMMTIFGILKAMHTHRSDDPLINHEFQELLTGIVLIIGISAFAIIPLLHHNKKFEKHVL